MLSRYEAVGDKRSSSRRTAGNRSGIRAEFLAPVESIVDVYEAGYDAEEIADEFDVSSYVIEDQMRNQDRIRGACHTLN